MGTIFDFEMFPRIETSRLILRELRGEDADAVFRIFSEPEVMKYMNMGMFTSIEEAQALIERQRRRFEQKERFRWGIALKDSDTIIGTGGYVAWNKMWYNAELGYDLARPYWGQGLMTEAVRAMIQFGFEHMGLNRIEAEVMPENIASIRFLSKLGFEEEGVLHERSFWQDAFHDLVMFALLKRKYELPWTTNSEDSMYIYYVLRGTRAGTSVEVEGDIDEEHFPGVDLGDGKAILNYLVPVVDREAGSTGNWEEAELTDSFFNREDEYINFNGRWMRRSDAPWRKDRDN